MEDVEVRCFHWMRFLYRQFRRVENYGHDPKKDECENMTTEAFQAVL